MIRLTLSLPILLLLSAIAQAQTFSGCHFHGSTEYCYGPDGEETAVFTSTPRTPTSAAGIATTAASAPRTTTAGTSGAGTSTTATSDAGITPGPAPVPVATTEAAPAMSAVTDCHLHGSATYCIASNSVEVMISGTATATGEPPAQYTDCHAHGPEQYCVGPDGEEVQVLAEGSAAGISESSDKSEGEDCHFHAGVEHCVGHGESETAAASTSCELREREYNIPVRVGTLFVILVTSSIAVFGPILLTRFFHVATSGLTFTIIRQFGTGVIISTALIHLVTHAELMFSNPCLGGLTYEATTTAIVVAGLFLSFLLDYTGHRAMSARRWKSAAADGGNTNDVEGNHQKSASGTTEQDNMSTSISPNVGQGHNISLDADDKLKVMIMEAGIIFHSTIIGVTLVVAGDSFYIILFVVILFHQMFEGIALGARLSNMKNSSLVIQLLMALAFALVTPVGMAIGLGVLGSFNGNDRNTIVAMGTLDALSAGILLWSGIVDMWSRDWMYGELSNSGAVKTTVAMIALVLGMALMGLLGKWA